MIPDEVVFSVPAKSALALDEMARTRQRANRTGSSFLSLPRKGAQSRMFSAMLHRPTIPSDGGGEDVGSRELEDDTGSNVGNKDDGESNNEQEQEEDDDPNVEEEGEGSKNSGEGEESSSNANKEEDGASNGGKDDSSNNEEEDDGSKGKKVSSNEEKDSEEEEEEEEEDGSKGQDKDAVSNEEEKEEDEVSEDADGTKAVASKLLQLGLSSHLEAEASPVSPGLASSPSAAAQPAVAPTRSAKDNNSDVPLTPLTSMMKKPRVPILSKTDASSKRGNEVPVSPDQALSFLSTVGSPARSKVAAKELTAKLKDAFMEHSGPLETAAREVLPDINNLSNEASTFFMSIFGSDTIPALKHADEHLASFVSLGTSLKFAMLAEQKLPDQSYQFKLRYFAGLGSNVVKDRSQPDQISSVLVARGIKRFFTSVFNNPENTPIEDCVARARSLYITVKSHTPAKGGKGTKSSKVMPLETKSAKHDDAVDSPDETIIACINFALMEGKGMYVNWLATSNEIINPRKYGPDLLLLCQNQTWQHRHLALFLLKAAHVSVVLHSRLNNTLTNKFHIVLQARTSPSENSAHFYGKVGFEEGGIVEQESQVDIMVFPGFASILNNAASSTTDYIHFIWDTEDIVIFKNSTGTFGKLRSFSKQVDRSFSSVDHVGGKHTAFSVPFAFVREHLQLLAQQLEFFFLPFQPGVDMDDFIMPTRSYSSRETTSLNERAVESIKKHNGWLTDEAIDLYSRWYVTFCSMLFLRFGK